MSYLSSVIFLQFAFWLFCERLIYDLFGCIKKGPNVSLCVDMSVCNSVFVYAVSWISDESGLLAKVSMVSLVCFVHSSNLSTCASNFLGTSTSCWQGKASFYISSFYSISSGNLYLHFVAQQ